MGRVVLLSALGMVVAHFACTALAIAEPGTAQKQHLQRWREFVLEASSRFGVPTEWIYAVMDAESGGRDKRDGKPITSSAGAIGLMQVMPNTYREIRMRHKLGPDPHDARDNILAGAAYLKAMYDRFGYPGLFAAYNAGPGRYEDYLNTGRPLPLETRSYLRSLSKMLTPIIETPPATSSGKLFFPLPTTKDNLLFGNNHDTRRELFVPLSSLDRSRNQTDVAD